MVSFDWDIDCRPQHSWETKGRLLPYDSTPENIADAQAYFGVHRVDGGWVYREWAPEARELYLTGEFNGWHNTSHPMLNLGNGAWVLFLAGDDALWEGCRVKTIVDVSPEEEDTAK